MKAIYKYLLKEVEGKRDEFEVEIPCNAQILKVKPQFSEFGQGIMLWAIVDLDPVFEGLTYKKRFKLLFTGSQFENDALNDYEYVDTYEICGIIGHLFRLK